MPDWSYRTVFQPLLFLLPAERGRDLALGAMGRLSRFPFGSTVIDLMGHMRPDRRLSQTEQGLDISGPVMIQVLEGENAILKNRGLMGATDPKKAAAGTIRADCADSIDANAVHGSDAPETAAVEIAFFFAGMNVY